MEEVYWGPSNLLREYWGWRRFRWGGWTGPMLTLALKGPAAPLYPEMERICWKTVEGVGPGTVEDANRQ